MESKKGRSNEREYENEESAPRQSLCIILMHRTVDRNNVRMVHGHCKHRREQDLRLVI